MLGLERAKLEHEPVVFGVRNFRIIERVIAIVVSVQQTAQFRGPRCRFLPRTGGFLSAHPRINSRAARPENARCPRAKRPRAAATRACLLRPAPSRTTPPPSLAQYPATRPRCRGAGSDPATRRKGLRPGTLDPASRQRRKSRAQ